MAFFSFSLNPRRVGCTYGRLYVWTPRAAGIVEQQEETDLLKQTLAALPDRQREALTLRFFEDLSVEQTAEAMGCAAGTVKATVHQALRALREKMKQLK